MPGTVICFGDSNTYGYDPKSLTGDAYPEKACWTGILGAGTGWTVLNYGVCGRQIPYGRDKILFMCGLMEAWRREKPPVWLFIMLGTNDLLQTKGFTAGETGSRMEQLLSALTETPAYTSGDIHICLISPPGLSCGTWVQDKKLIEESEKLDKVYAALSQKKGILFISGASAGIRTAYDGVHMTPEGHKRLAELIMRGSGIFKAV